MQKYIIRIIFVIIFLPVAMYLLLKENSNNKSNSLNNEVKEEILSSFSDEYLHDTSDYLTYEYVINNQLDTTLLGVASIIIDEENSLYVLDKKDYSVKKFNKHGKLLSVKYDIGLFENGTRYDPEFMAYDYYNQRFAIVDKTYQLILIYDKNLVFYKKIFVSNQIIDFVFSEKGEAVAACMLDDVIRFYTYNESYDSYRTNDIKWKSPIKYFNLLHLNYRKNAIICVYTFINKIETYDKDFNLINSFSIDELPMQSNLLSGSDKIPDARLFAASATRDSLLFLISGYYSEFENKLLYIINPEGKILAKEYLKEETSKIEVDFEMEIYAVDIKKRRIFKYYIKSLL